MLSALLSILLLALILWLVYFIASKFMSGTPLTITGVILGIILVVYALQRLGVAGSLDL